MATVYETFDDQYIVDPDTGCWLWQRSTVSKGYGKLLVDGEWKLAHRVAYERAKGPIPPGKIVMHDCDTRPCVNPDHIRLGTVGDNNADRAAKGRSCRHRPPGAYRKLTANGVRFIRDT